MDVGLLHERDDLEGIRVLLCDARAGQRLEARLREVDQLGLRLATSGRLALPGDERLRRVHALDSLAWWAVPRSDAS